MKDSEVEKNNGTGATIAQRLKKLGDLINKTGAMDFPEKAGPGKSGDEIDAIATGINALNEELMRAQQEKKKHMEELEKVKARLKKTGEQSVKANIWLEEKAAERTKELIKSEKKFRALIENSNDGIGMLNRQEEVIYVSPSVIKINGFSADELTGKKGLGQVHPEDIPEAVKMREEAFKNPGMPVCSQHRIRHKNSHWIWIEETLTNLIHDPDINALVVNFRDITGRKEAEEKLMASEQQFRSSLDTMLEGIQIINFGWRYLYVNEAVAKQGKYPREELLGHTMMEKYPGIEKTELFSILRQCMSERVSKSMDNEFVYPDGSKDWFELSIHPVPEGILILSINITERRKAEEKIKKLNDELEQKVRERTAQLESANKELEAFTYSVSHDMRAPLRAVNGYARMIEEDYAAVLDHEGRRLLHVIHDNGRKMGALIDDLLAFSRLGKKDIQKTHLDMNELAEGVLHELNKSVHHRAKVKIGRLHPAWGDYSLMSQVLINLLSNGIKYSSKKKNPRVEINSEKKDNHIVYSVKDNGVGFDMQYVHKLFGVFQRLHTVEEFEGTGVGLAIVHRIVKKHGGEVWAEAVLNKGAAFYFSLPVK